MLLSPSPNDQGHGTAGIQGHIPPYFPLLNLVEVFIAGTRVPLFLTDKPNLPVVVLAQRVWLTITLHISYRKIKVSTKALGRNGTGGSLARVTPSHRCKKCPQK